MRVSFLCENSQLFVIYCQVSNAILSRASEHSGNSSLSSASKELSACNITVTSREFEMDECVCCVLKDEQRDCELFS